MQQLRQYYKAFQVGLMFLGGLFLATIIFPLLNLFHHRTAEKLSGLLVKNWHLLLTKALKIRIHRSGHIMPPPGLFVSNHISWLDIVILGSQGSFNFISKYEVAEWPVIGFLAKQSGTLFVRRGDHHSTQSTAEEMIWRLRRGRHLVLFPEGTSSPCNQVLRFHARLFQPALLANVPIQAVGLAYRNDAKVLAPFVGDDDFLPHLWRILALNQIDVELFFCEPAPAGRFDRTGLDRKSVV